MNHQAHTKRPNPVTRRTKCGKPKLFARQLDAASNYQKPDGGNGWRKKQQAKHQKAANIRANGLPLELVDTKKRSVNSPMRSQAVILGVTGAYSKLSALKTSKGWKNKELSLS